MKPLTTISVSTLKCTETNGTHEQVEEKEDEPHLFSLTKCSLTVGDFVVPRTVVFVTCLRKANSIVGTLK